MFVANTLVPVDVPLGRFYRSKHKRRIKVGLTTYRDFMQGLSWSDFKWSGNINYEIPHQ